MPSMDALGLATAGRWCESLLTTLAPGPAFDKGLQARPPLALGVIGPSCYVFQEAGRRESSAQSAAELHPTGPAEPSLTAGSNCR